MRIRVGVVTNMRAGQTGGHVRKVCELLDGRPDTWHVATTTAAAVPEVLGDLARHGVDVLVVNGGDGTLHRALTEILRNSLFERVPRIALLRGGRTNMAALDLGARRNPVAALAGLLRDIDRGNLEHREVRRPVLRVEVGRSREAYYGMFFGPGVIHRAIQVVHQVFPPGKARGVFGSSLTTGTLVARAAMRDSTGILTPDKFEMRLDGELVDDAEFFLVMATSLERLFLRLRPFWGREPAPVRLTALAADARRLHAYVPGILRGRPRAGATPENGYRSRNVHQAELRFDCGFTIDGELFPPDPDRIVRIGAVERVRFLRT